MYIYGVSHFNQASQFSPKLLMMQKKCFRWKWNGFKENVFWSRCFFWMDLKRYEGYLHFLK